MFRIISILVLAMIAYYVIKSWLSRPAMPEPGPEVKRKSGKMDFDDEGEMIKDPVCGVYVESGSEHFVVHEGRRVLFCSEECRRKYMEGLSS